MINTIINADVLDGLAQLPDCSVNCVVTSPPWWMLRDYGSKGQIGREETLEEYIYKITKVFREVRRVLRDDGTLWLNMGDTYTHATIPGGGDPTIGKRNTDKSQYAPTTVKGLPIKSLIGIPWRVAFALQSDGWILRQDVIIYKPNAMPGSMKDRCTTAHEYLFLLSKSGKYYFDNVAIQEPAKHRDDIRPFGKRDSGDHGQGGRVYTQRKPAGWETRQGAHGAFHREGRAPDIEYTTTHSPYRNKRSVWTISNRPFRHAHFATFSPDLVKPCILAGCPTGGVVLDPFMGAGTTAIVARMLDRRYIGIELNPEYVALAQKRMEKELGKLDALFAEVTA